jgi:hypothetical protein
VVPPALLLARRASYGPTAALLTEIEATGAVAWLEQQLDPGSIGDPAGDRIDGTFPLVALPPSELVTRTDKPWEQRGPLQQRALGRAVWSRRQLAEVMIEFWSNHLNVYVGGDDGQMWGRPGYDAMIRSHALGSFRTILRETGLHPSMLHSLDNASSVGAAPNENYARELMELHTLGVGGGYGEQDVKQLALLLTGWVSRSEDGWETSSSRTATTSVPSPCWACLRQRPRGRRPRRVGRGRRAARPPPVHGDPPGDEARPPLVADEPPASLVERLAGVYLASDTEIVPVLRALFTSAEFSASGGQKVKRPFEQLVSAVRLLAAGEPTDVDEATKNLVWWLTAQQPLGWPAPNGYPDRAGAWQSPGVALDLLNRIAWMLWDGQSWLDFDAVDRIVALLVDSGRLDFAGVTDAAARTVLLRPATETEVAATSALLGSGWITQPLGDDGTRRAAAHLAAAFLMCGPDHLQR